MSSDDLIHDRGRGPEIKGTRITVYSILDYALACWPPERIASLLGLRKDQVEAAIHYIDENTIEVLKEYIRILEDAEHGNPPALQRQLDEGHLEFRKRIEQVRQIKAKADSEIEQVIQQHRRAEGTETAHAAHPGGQ